LGGPKKEERSLLIVEDDEGLQKQLRWCFDKYSVHTAVDRQSALIAVRRFTPSVITLDLGLPPDPANVSEGFGTLQDILRLTPHAKVIVVTGNDDHDNAVRAVGLGAYDFYQKPIDADTLRMIVDRAFYLYELEDENRVLTASRANSPLDGVIANSPEMLRVCRTIEKVAPTDVTTLLLGESGTGKELLARALHGLSVRAKEPFVAINCAAIPDALLESELFGYEKGAFTGAVKRTTGKFELADRGTLFLDEIGDLSMSLQAKLLRFLQERVIERIGGREEIPLDVRVVCATNRDLAAMMEDGEFREDLYYRLSEITVKVPPLRQREGDAVLLARTFLEKYSTNSTTRRRSFSKGSLTSIERYSWPGNVRELENRIKRASIMAEGHQITSEDLELDATQENRMPLNLRQVREQAELGAVQRALAFSGGNISRAAELLGVSRPTFYDLLNKLNIKPKTE
jgi:two-component system NtrC family response regulator